MFRNPKFRAMEEYVKSLKECYSQLSKMMHHIEEQNVSLGLKWMNRWHKNKE